MNNAPYGKRGYLIRIIYLLISCIVYLFTAGGRIWSYRAVILCYHGINDSQHHRFCWQMSRIHTVSIPVNRLLLNLHYDKSHRPYVGVTFDDAFSNLIDNAIPVLSDLNIHATIFAVTNNLGLTPQWRIPETHPDKFETTMTRDQLAAIGTSTFIDIGSHTADHTNLSLLDSECIRRQLVLSRRELENILKRPVNTLALPYGAYGDATISYALDAGYTHIFSLDPKMRHVRSKNPLIGRFSMDPDAWKIEFILTCAGAYCWLSPFRRLISILGMRS